MVDNCGSRAIRSSSEAPFLLACPLCRNPLTLQMQSAECKKCGETYAAREGIWRMLPPDREKAHREFLERYQSVRSSEGWGSTTSTYYQKLPIVSRADPQSRIWRIRNKSYRAFMRLLPADGSFRVLDAGAGNCWMSNRLVLRGDMVASVDISDSIEDGLGARIHYSTRLECYQAEFDHLPFQDGQFDLVVYNGSLHYASSLISTLMEARRTLLPHGRIVVMDSPFYSDAVSGEAMLRETELKRSQACGPGPSRAMSGYLTEARMRDACGEAGLRANVWRADAKWHQRLRRRWIAGRIKREPGRFPIVLLEPLSPST